MFYEMTYTIVWFNIAQLSSLSNVIHFPDSMSVINPEDMSNILKYLMIWTLFIKLFVILDMISILLIKIISQI